MALGASQPRSAESVEQLGGAVMREATPTLTDQKAWPPVLDTMVHSSGVSMLALGHALMALVFNQLRSSPAARRVVCSGKYLNRVFSWGMSGCVVLLLVLADPSTAVESFGFEADEAGEKILALVTLRLLQQKLVEFGIFLAPESGVS